MGFLCRFFCCRSSSSDRKHSILGGILPGKINGWNLNIIPLKRKNNLPGRMTKLECMTILVPRVPLKVQNVSVSNESCINSLGPSFSASTLHSYKRFPSCNWGVGTRNDKKNPQLPSWSCFSRWWQLKYFLEFSPRKLGKMNPL